MKDNRYPHRLDPEIRRHLEEAVPRRCAEQDAPYVNAGVDSDAVAAEVAARAGRPDLAAIARRYEWGCEPPQCTDDRGTMLVWIGDLERALAEAQTALETVLTALEWMDGWGQDSAGMAQARTLHYDLTGKAATLLPVVRAALARGGAEA